MSIGKQFSADIKLVADICKSEDKKYPRREQWDDLTKTSSVIKRIASYTCRPC